MAARSKPVQLAALSTANMRETCPDEKARSRRSSHAPVEN
jgi:hypothetical protein